MCVIHPPSVSAEGGSGTPGRPLAPLSTPICHYLFKLLFDLLMGCDTFPL
jgi:hypothetical protein